MKLHQTIAALDDSWHRSQCCDSSLMTNSRVQHPGLHIGFRSLWEVPLFKKKSNLIVSIFIFNMSDEWIYKSMCLIHRKTCNMIIWNAKSFWKLFCKCRVKFNCDLGNKSCSTWLSGFTVEYESFFTVFSWHAAPTWIKKNCYMYSCVFAANYLFLKIHSILQS